MMSGFVLVTLKLLIGFFALTIIINLSGKGNLAPSSASEQVQNYVLSPKRIKQHNVKAKQLIEGKGRMVMRTCSWVSMLTAG